MKSQDIDYQRVTIGLTMFVVAGVVAFFATPMFKVSQSALETLVTIFSILAGFLVAVMTIIGDAAATRGLRSRADVVRTQEMLRRLNRHELTFYLYLFALTLLFVVSLFDREEKPPPDWMYYVVLWVSCFALLISFRLPSALTSIHRKQLAESARSTDRPE